MVESNGVYTDFLRAEARRLTSSLSGRVTPIGRICFEIGATIERAALIDYRAYIAIPRSEREYARISIPMRRSHEAPPALLAYERFCVAHELGHLLLYRKFSLKACTSSEYWKHEAYCDDFARHLLIPDRLVLNGSFEDDIISKAVVLGRETKVPVMHAARRIAEVVPGISLLKVNAHRGVVNIRSTSLPGNAGCNKKISGIMARRITSVVERQSLEYDCTLGFDEVRRFLPQMKGDLFKVRIRKLEAQAHAALVSVAAVHA